LLQNDVSKKKSICRELLGFYTFTYLPAVTLCGQWPALGFVYVEFEVEMVPDPIRPNLSILLTSSK